MTVPFGVPAHFPDDTGADTFVAQLPTAVAPADRAYLSTKPPLFLLRVPGHGEEYDRRVRRVVEALRQPLDDKGKLVQHAALEAGAAGTGLLAAAAGERLGYGIPRHMTPDCFPQFSLLRDVIADVMGHGAGGGTAAGAKALRDRAYVQRVQRGGLPAVLWRLGGGANPPAEGLHGWLLGILWTRGCRAARRSHAGGGRSARPGNSSGRCVFRRSGARGGSGPNSTPSAARRTSSGCWTTWPSGRC
jgi:hypothetical protein